MTRNYQAPLERILVIEDAAASAEMITHALEHEGYQCVLAWTGADGLARLQEQSFSLVIIDRMLPDAGYQVCQSVKKRDPLLPVMMIGVHSTVDDEVKGFELGADEYIAEPFNQAEFRARVQAILRSRATQLFLVQYSQQTAISE